jgi:hypothetical protein
MNIHHFPFGKNQLFDTNHLTGEIIGAAIEVHKVIGPWFIRIRI